MNSTRCEIEEKDVHKLLSAGSADAALLYLYLHSGNAFENAEKHLKLSQGRLQCASATLRQLGLWQEEKTHSIVMGERPRYTEQDVAQAQEDMDFKSLRFELERQLGRILSTEELKILLGFVRYLGLPTDVIHILVCYCRDRAKQKGRLRAPSLVSIEKEAYAWAEQGIDTIEEAAAFIQTQNVRFGRMQKLMELLQIRGRSLTQAENRYAQQWLDYGFAEDALALAYERTCLNTGGLNWAYMNKILTRWHQAGFTSVQQIKDGDKRNVPQGATGQLGQAELDAIARVLQEG